MKKNTLALALALALASVCLSSCGLKSCYCCKLVGDQAVSEETLTDIDRSCESLNTSTYKCMEEGSHLPCSAIAFDLKK